MGGAKCANCRLINLATDTTCRRCGHELVSVSWGRQIGGPRDRAKHSSFLWPLLGLLVAAAALYYVYSGAEQSIESVQPTTPIAPPPVNRNQAQQQQISSYKTAVQNSNGLSESQRHTAEVEKMTRSAQ